MSALTLMLLACDDSPAQSDSCENHAPVVEDVTLAPEDPVCGDALVCTATASDADGDALSLSYSWTIDGAPQSETSATLLSGWMPGEVIQCSVIANDGLSDSVAVASNPVTAVNTGPTAPAVEITPADPTEDDSLLCSIVTPATDCDGDALTTTLSWTLDGAAWTGTTSTTTESGDTIEEPDTVEGQEWTCTAVATDGAETSEPGSDTVVVGDGFDFFPPGDIEPEDADWCFYGAESDYLGWRTWSAPDFDGDGLADFAMTAQYADSGGMANNGAVYLFRAADLPATQSVDASDAWITLWGSEEGDRLGRGVQIVPDMDGDGLDELVVSAEFGDEDNGAVYIFLGASLAARSGDVSVDDADIKLIDDISYSDAGFGFGLAPADYDGDGIGDIAVGAPYVHYATYQAGYVFVFRGVDILGGGTFESSDHSVYRVIGEENQGFLGFSMTALDDLDGDGLPELAAGAYLTDVTGNDGGKAYILLSTGGLDVGAAHTGYKEITDVADTTIWGQFGGVRTGHDLARMGDWDGDGLGDLVVGSVGYDDGGGEWSGRSYLFSGADLTTGGDLQVSSALIAFDSISAEGRLGYSNWGDFDVDGDGLPDLLIGGHSAEYGGMAYLFRGSSMTTGLYSVGNADARFVTNDSDDSNGKSVTSPGDVNGDGYDDILVSAYTDGDAATRAGRVCLYLTP